jgi:hypothetical protein
MKIWERWFFCIKFMAPGRKIYGHQIYVSRAMQPTLGTFAFVTSIILCEVLQRLIVCYTDKIKVTILVTLAGFLPEGTYM